MLPTLLAAAAAAPGETTSEKETGRCHRRESEKHTGTERGEHTYTHTLGETVAEFADCLRPPFDAKAA